MNKKIMAMVLGMAVCVGQVEAVDVCSTISNLELFCNPSVKLVSEKCTSELETISNKYQQIINYLNNELIKQSESGGKYKANTSVSLPNWQPDTLVEGIIGGLVSSHCCWFKIDEVRTKCKANANSIKNGMEQAIQELIKNIQDQYNRYQQDFNSSSDPGNTSGSESNSSSSTSGTTSGSGSNSSSSYNPYGSGGSSGGSVSRSAGANDNQDFNAFKSKVKQGANEDNNIVKGKNQGKSSASQGDTSFYDVVGERPPSNPKFKDLSN